MHVLNEITFMENYLPFYKNCLFLTKKIFGILKEIELCFEHRNIIYVVFKKSSERIEPMPGVFTNKSGR